MTPTTTARHKRRRLPVSNPRQLLLLPMILLQRQRSVIVMIRGPSRRPMAETIADVAPTILRLPRREQGAVVGML
jgi:hypothetical protein